MLLAKEFLKKFHEGFFSDTGTIGQTTRKHKGEAQTSFQVHCGIVRKQCTHIHTFSHLSHLFRPLRGQRRDEKAIQREKERGVKEGQEDERQKEEPTAELKEEEVERRGKKR